MRAQRTPPARFLVGRPGQHRAGRERRAGDRSTTGGATPTIAARWKSLVASTQSSLRPSTAWPSATLAKRTTRGAEAHVVGARDAGERRARERDGAGPQRARARTPPRGARIALSRASGTRPSALRCSPSAPAPPCCRAGTGRSGSACGSGSPVGGWIGLGTSPCSRMRLRLTVRVGNRHRRQQRFGVGMQRLRVELAAPARSRRCGRGTSPRRGR